jgi:hypothetical protein
VPTSSVSYAGCCTDRRARAREAVSRTPLTLGSECGSRKGAFDLARPIIQRRSEHAVQRPVDAEEVTPTSSRFSPEEDLGRLGLGVPAGFGGDEKLAKHPDNFRFVFPDKCHWDDARKLTENVGAGLARGS